MSRLSELLDRRACPLLNRHLVVSCRRSTVVLTPWSGADQRRRVVLRHRRDGPGAPTTPPCRDGRCRRDRREVAPAVSSRATSLRRQPCHVVDVAAVNELPNRRPPPLLRCLLRRCRRVCCCRLCPRCGCMCVSVSFLLVGDPVPLCIACNNCYFTCLFLLVLLLLVFANYISLFYLGRT